MPAFIDITGQRFGRLTAIRPVKKGRLIHWDCICDCGSRLSPVGATLRNGSSKSCGCARDEWINGEFKKVNVKHGLFGTKIYGIWAGMITRCTNEKDHSYPAYGGRGISVCREWREDPVRFYTDVGDPPEGMTLDRIDVDGDYCPSNVRWATPEQQSNNKRDNVYLTHKGRTMTLTQWAREIGMSVSGLSYRLTVCSTDEALTHKKNEKNVRHNLNGESLTVNEWAVRAGLKVKTLRQRLKDGWTLDRAVNTPYDIRRKDK